MNNILQYFIQKSIPKIEERSLEFIQNGEDISKVVQMVKEKTDELGRKIVSSILEAADQAIKDSLQRKKYWNVERTDDIKKIITLLGEIEYKRTYYKCKNGNGYKYLSDELFGIGVHDRVDLGVSSKISELASEISYRKSGKSACSVNISGQTAMNCVRNIKDLKVKDDEPEQKEIEFLYVEADEDHISLQNGRKTIAKLIYVHEGKELLNKRNKLKSVKYFSSVKAKPDDLWNEVYEYIACKYNLDKIKRIYISGDGASWIKTGLDYLPNSKFVLDRFHMNKYILSATAQSRNYAAKIWSVLNVADKKKAIEIFEKLETETLEENKRLEIKAILKYFLNNWDGIEIQAYEDDKVLGCSAEGHVSHVLSSRMSSRPLGWSLDGADKMARLRAFKANGGNIYEFLKSSNKKEDKIKITKKISKEIHRKIKSKTNEKLCNIEVLNQGKKTGLYNKLKSLKYENILNITGSGF